MLLQVPNVAARGKGDGYWPQWRGVAGLGISSERTFPVEWNESKNIQWKTSIEGRGHSSPIVWGAEDLSDDSS
jgi:hypothetical protein